MLTSQEMNSGTDADLHCIFKLSDDTLFCSGGNQSHGIILKSTNRGVNWQIINTSLPAKINALYFFNSLNGFAGGDGLQFFETNDGGVNWNQVLLPPIGTEFINPIRQIIFLSDSIGFFCSGQEFGHGLIAKTIDRGKHWKLLQWYHELRSISFKDDIHGYCGGYGAMLFTDNQGESWQLTESNNEFVTSINYNLSKSVACGYNGNILQNNNTLNWEIASKGNQSFTARSHFNAVSTGDHIHFFVFGNNGKCALSDDGGNEWKYASAFDGFTIYNAICLTDQSGITVGEKGKIFYFQK